MVPDGWKQGRVKDGEIGVLKISAVNYGIFNEKQYKTVIPEDVSRAKLNPKKGQISKILSTWDKTIATVEKLIENCKQQKKTLMQQLLMGKRRVTIDAEQAVKLSA